MGGTGHDYLLGIFNISSDEETCNSLEMVWNTILLGRQSALYNSREWRGIAEIKLDPNNVPTGQPQIIGKLVVGKH